ncbi:expressed unknown protein [Seminavis robusta]|uniref:Hexosyltransferase n=1 Tax=Seminavis robusta TaxID=568900 RepID=A0A9N8ECP6_9STRA|nr:expressed unknown protein [Seminavis robusta]|eukprot:Sro761_g198540.1 n/a (566) ;mRNA; f:25072-26860
MNNSHASTTKKKNDSTIFCGGQKRIGGRVGLTMSGLVCFLLHTLFQHKQVISLFHPHQSNLLDTETLDRQLQQESLEENTAKRRQEPDGMTRHTKQQGGNVTQSAEKTAFSLEDRYPRPVDSMQHDKEMKEEEPTTSKQQKPQLPLSMDAEPTNNILPEPQSAILPKKKRPSNKHKPIPDLHADLPIYKTTSPYAYVLMCWSVNPQLSQSYRAYLANMAITAKVLRTHGSTADIVAVFRLDNATETLPRQDEALLHAMNISIRYLPQETPNFNRRKGTKFLHKFYTFGMTEYRRVLFLDGDILPKANLDYMFELSDGGPNAMFKPNVILAGVVEPCNTGFFVVEPTKDAYNQAQHLIRSHIRKTTMKNFDMEAGWGQPFVNGDHWENNMETGVKWDFLNAWSDQGLHYHMTKYVMQNVTQILSRKIINFGRAPNNGSTIEEKVITVTSRWDSPLKEYSKPSYKTGPSLCKKWTGNHHATEKWPGCVPPYSDFDHYSGKTKFWHKPVPEDVWDDMPRQPKSMIHLWYQLLYKLKKEDGLDIQPILQAINAETDWDKALLSGPVEAK